MQVRPAQREPDGCHNDHLFQHAESGEDGSWYFRSDQIPWLR
jgi:hypothetical protein